MSIAESLFSDSFVGRLASLASENAHRYQTNSPFPSIYFDNFLPVEVVDAVLRDFPEPKRLSWTEFADKNQSKLAFDLAEKLPSSIREVLFFLNSRPMLQFLEELTGIKDIIPDPYFVGGGLHQIERGGYLEVHADFNRHQKLKLDRRLNLLLYLNQDWKEEYGGHFELWNREMTASVTKILPVFNRCAVFTTSSFSYHGHPTPLACPPGRTRKSLATYYYSNGRPEEEARDSHDTLFQHRPGRTEALRRGTVKHIMRAITPPILMDMAARVRKA
ncbi:MAG: 2OG-Fe(II) oxygenase [Acidobacteriia bacterium]|nr:2OG-Fe(II) oxygenase [Terriglobia bacterium]